MEQFIGKVLHDRYRIQSLLGRQRGRRTLLAKDLQTGLSVVVKLLLFAPDFTWDDLKLFEREAEVLKALDHPAIPEYLDHFEVEIELGKGFALVQTYIEARSLQDWMQSGRTFSEDGLRAIAKDLLGILDYLHLRQPSVIHRDIKPSNILLGDRSGNSLGQIYLIDFGSVQTVAHSGTRTIVGTYGYMPPEQFGGQTAPTSDLYATGATLIYLATGQHPDQLPQREMRILFDDKVNLSPKLIDWLKWLTEPSIDLRLNSAKQALEALENLNVREGDLAWVNKPANSKVKVTNTRQMLEILFQPSGFDLRLIGLISQLAYTSFFLKCFSNPAAILGSEGGWFLIFFLILLLIISHCIWCIFSIFLLTVRWSITRSEIVHRWEVLGWCARSRTIARQDITRIEFVPLRYERSAQGGTTATPPRIQIWTGTKYFLLGDSRDSLTELELVWLARSLADCLNLPMIDLRDENTCMNFRSQ